MAARVVNMLLGIWLLAAPDLLGYDGPARINHLIMGPIAATIAVIAASEVLRELRWLNLLAGAWLVLAPLLIPHDQQALFTGVTTGMAMTALALVRGQTKERLGGGWRAVLRPPDWQASDRQASDPHASAATEGGEHE
ncbi:MAG: SPW repeat protein [Chloroflexota bacterium]|nr:SPW repeat protein [Chloroflexota bacterium]